MLTGFLSKNRDAIIEKWRQYTLETYPPDARTYFKREKDPIANPVGSTIKREIEAVFDRMLDGNDADELSPYFTELMKIRAVQGLSPAEAVSFIFRLKLAVRDVIGGEIKKQGLHDDLFEFDRRVDELALAAFNKYMVERERIFEIRANEVRRRSAILFKRMTGESGELSGSCPSRIGDGPEGDCSDCSPDREER